MSQDQITVNIQGKEFVFKKDEISKLQAQSFEQIALGDRPLAYTLFMVNHLNEENQMMEGELRYLKSENSALVETLKKILGDVKLNPEQKVGGATHLLNTYQEIAENVKEDLLTLLERMFGNE